MTSIVLVYKDGTTENRTLNSCTNLRANIEGKSASERWNEDLKAYIFSEEDYNREMLEAEKFKLF